MWDLPSYRRVPEYPTPKMMRVKDYDDMASDCGMWIAKYVLCIFNFIFFILGTIVLATGLWLVIDKASLIALLKMVDMENVKNFTQPAVIEQMAYVLIVCGALMFFLSFLGYCGAIRESPCLLTTYGIFMILILIAEITVGGLAAGYKDRTKTETKSFLQSTITKYYSTHENADAVTLMWNHLMAQMKCCGVDSYRDFETSKTWNENKGNRTIPEACCILKDITNITPLYSECTTYPNIDNSYLEQGCYNAVMDWFISNRNIVIAVGIGVGVTQLLAIFLAFCLCKSIDKYRGMRL